LENRELISFYSIKKYNPINEIISVLKIRFVPDTVTIPIIPAIWEAEIGRIMV
jgi:hypothetical protein